MNSRNIFSFSLFALLLLLPFLVQAVPSSPPVSEGQLIAGALTLLSLFMGVIAYFLRQEHAVLKEVAHDIGEMKKDHAIQLLRQETEVKVLATDLRHELASLKNEQAYIKDKLRRLSDERTK
jgi:hypothetical protein